MTLGKPYVVSFLFPSMVTVYLYSLVCSYALSMEHKRSKPKDLLVTEELKTYVVVSSYVILCFWVYQCYCRSVELTRVVIFKSEYEPKEKHEYGFKSPALRKHF